MKKFFTISMLAIAAMAAFSCKQEIVVDDASLVKAPKVVTAYTDADVTASKTSLDGVTVIWSANDVVKAYSLDGDIVTSTNTVVSEGGKKAEFTFDDLSAGDEIYMYAYPAALITRMDGDNEVIYGSIPTEQEAVANSFANGANLAVAEAGDTPFFRNVGGFVSFKIKNDNIVSIKLIADDYLTGGTAEVTVDKDPLAVVEGGSKEVCINAAPTAPLANGTTYYAVVYPGTFSGLQLVFTDASGRTATYTNPNTLSVGRNSNLVVWDAEIPDGKWKSADPFEGEWILTGIKDTQAYACGKYVSGNNIQNVVAITIDSANQIIEGDNLQDCKITITKVNEGDYAGYYTIQDANKSNNYWYAAGSSTNNYLKANTLANSDQYYWSISEDGGNHVITAKSNNRNTIKFNTNGTSTIFSCYQATGTQAAVKLYPYSWAVIDEREQVATPTFSPASGVVAANSTVTISCETAGATIYYTTDGSAPTSSSSVYSTPIVITAATTIKAFAVKDGYKDSAVATAEFAVGIVNTSTEDNPYSPAEAVELAGKLAGSTLSDVYVKGIVSKITTAYNSTYDNVSFTISSDGLETGTQFTCYRATASSESDFEVGDAVLMKGTLKMFNTTPELDAGATCVEKLKKPTFSPDGGVFTASQSVTISAESGATIYYTTNGDAPTTASSVYSSALNFTETTTVKAIASKGILTTGVVSATFTKNNPDVESVVYTLDGTKTGGTNGYAEASSITQSGIAWKVTANTQQNPWRVGGKSITNEDRTIYSTASINKNISKIEITHGTATDITVNSMTVIVATDAAFSSVVSTLTPTFVASDVVTVERPSGKDWSNCYYKIVYNVTVKVDSNKYVQFVKAEFTGK